MQNPTRKDRSRALILQAAGQAFQRDGYDSVTIEAIAQAAGLTRKTVYNLFGSKEDIALTLIAAVEAADAGYRARIAAGEEAVGLLTGVLEDSAGWCMAHPALARLALAPRHRPEITPPEGRPSFQGLVRDILRLGQTQGRIRADEPAEVLALFVLAVYGQAMLTALEHGKGMEIEISRILRLAVEGIGA